MHLFFCFFVFFFPQNCVRMALVGVVALLTVLLLLSEAIFLLTCSNILGLYSKVLWVHIFLQQPI